MRLLFLPGTTNSPASRVRVWQYVQPLRSMGHEVEIRLICPERHWTSSLPEGPLRKLHQAAGTGIRVGSALWALRDAEKFDVIFMNKDILPEIRINFLEPWLSRRNPRLVFDFDDAVYLGPRGKKLEKILPFFAHIIAGNPTLAEYAAGIAGAGRVSILPTVVNTDRIIPALNRMEGPLRIGWSGSSFTLKTCLPIVRNAVVELAQQEDFEFLVITEKKAELDWPGVRMRHVLWTPETEAQGLQQLDIGLMPLEDSPFERGKCGMKAIQYMAVGIPALVSPVGVNQEIVVEGLTGFHCDREEHWLNRLRELLEDAARRKQMGESGRQRAVSRYSLHYAIPKLLGIFETVSKGYSKKHENRV